MKTDEAYRATRPHEFMSMRRAFFVALALALAFMILTAYQSAATLMSRVVASDAMRAATGGAWSGKVAWDIGYFVVAQVMLHSAFAVVIWLLAGATVVLHPATRANLGRVVLSWFCVMAAAVIAYNAYWYPRTGLGAYYYDTLRTTVGPVAVGEILYIGVLAAVLLTLGAALLKMVMPRHDTRRARAWPAAVAIASIALVGLLHTIDRFAGAATSVSERPHVIVLGIDSLRLGDLARFGGRGVAPNLDRFLSEADLVKDTTTPAGRTFSSWVAILTGRSPNVTGARFNLADRRLVSANPTVADVLRSDGYRTVYSTDEVRFANIDETYGFDQVVTPPIGATDFLIGTYNELPLASVVANSRLGQFLFPFTYGNRGAATMFRPESYLSRLDREVSFERPTLLMLHLTASHWPYYVADTPISANQKTHEHDRPLYRVGLQVADSMFGEILSMLERKGALDNAIVIVLSDHGEALGLPEDSMFKDGTHIEGLRAPMKMIDVGHGQSVFSPVQYQVLLGFRAFGDRVGFSGAGRDLVGGASVEDIAPTILDLLDIEGDPLKANGQSLAAALRDSTSGSRVAPLERVRFTETDLRVLPNQDGSVDEVATGRNNSKFFEINPGTGRLNIRQRYAPLALAFKERAAFDETQLLAAIPAGPDAHQYILVDKTTSQGRLLLQRPGPEEPDAQRLWDAMHEHFGEEMKRAVSITRADWPAIDYAWATFPLDPAPSQQAQRAR